MHTMPSEPYLTITPDGGACMRRSWSSAHLSLIVMAILCCLATGEGPLARRGAVPVVIGDASGGGLLPAAAMPHPSDEQRRLLQAAIERNIADLGARGKLPTASLLAPPLAWPLRPNNGLSDFGYHGTTSFVDLDAAFPDHLLDYDCGLRTYDLPNG